MKLILIVAVFAGCAAAQGPTDVPPILQIVRKPGTGFRGTLRPYSGVRAAVDVIGMTSITGLPETWDIELHQTFAEIEDLDHAMASVAVNAADYSGPSSDELLAPARTMVLLYQPG